MSSGQVRYSLRSSARRATQAAQAGQVGAHNSEEDGDYLLDDEGPDNFVDDDGIEEMPDTPGTPTPAPRPDHTTGAQPVPQSGAGDDDDNEEEEEEATAPSRRVRRRLFPDARPSGATTRPFSPLRPAPGGGARLLPPTAADQVTFAPAYPAGFAPLRRPISAPVSSFLPGPRGGGGDEGSSLIDPRLLLGWVGPASGSGSASAAAGLGGGGGGGVVAAGLLASGHPNSTNAGGEGNAGSARQDNFVQWTNPVPESPFVMLPGTAPYGPFAVQRPNPRVPSANAVLALPLPSNGYVMSTAIDPANPYASFLRANSVALAQGHGAVTGQDARGGSRAVSRAVTVTMGPARVGRTTRTWDGVTAHPLRHPAYPPGLPHPADAATAATAAIRPSAHTVGSSFSLSSANQRATSSSSAALAMHPNVSSFNSGNEPEFEFAFPAAAHPSGNPIAFSSGNPAAFSSAAFPNVFPDAFPNSLPNAFLGSASDLHDPFTEHSHPTLSTAFPTAPQQPAFPEPAQDPTMVLRRMDPAVARQSVENAQSVEYQLLQLKVRNRADADRAQNMNAPNNLLTGNAQINENGYATLEFQVPNQADNDIDNLSTVTNADSDSAATRVAPSDAEHEAIDSEDSDDAAGCSDNNNNAEVISDEDDSDDDAPIPHVPAVSPMHIYNPHHNPAAAYWVALPPAPLMDEHTLLNKPPPSINMYSNPPLPAFDTDPFLPFAPWRVRQLPPFHPESTNRVITVAARYLPALGQLYPDATFLVSRHPASANFTGRLKGRALTTSMALHFPHLLDPSLSDDVTTQEADHTMYNVALAQRDWPIGGVAFLPNNAAAEAFVTALREAFDVLPGGQEAFYYVPHDIRLRSGGNGKGKGMWVCRAYEGRQGPQDERIVGEWVRSQGRGNGGGGGVVEEDDMGREVLVRMGEAWVEPERWPRVAAAVAAAGRGRKKGKKVKVAVEDEEEEE